MSTVKILHLSDFHWSEDKRNDQEIILESLWRGLENARSADLIPDLVVFTGDLVNAGERVEQFAGVKNAFLKPLKEISRHCPLIVVPGNHDIQRSVVREGGGYVQLGLKSSLSSVDKLNEFIDHLNQGDAANKEAIRRLKNYETAYDTFGCAAVSLDRPLLKTHKFEVNGVSVGVAVLNTAWRASGESDDVDRHYLLLGERNVDDAIKDLSDCEIRIAAFHHPLDWLADFDSAACFSRLYAEFDVLMNGHVHKSEPECRQNAFGTAVTSQAGSLYQGRYYNGFQFVTIDTERHKIKFNIFGYRDKRRTFDVDTELASGGMLEFDFKRRQNNTSDVVRQFLKDARSVIRQNAIDHFNLIGATSDASLDPKEVFICPPLTTTRSASLVDRDNRQQNSIDVAEFLGIDENFAIVGPRESSKTSIAHYVAVMSAEGAIDTPRVPAVIDFRRLQNFSQYEIRRAIGAYFGTLRSGLDIDEALDKGHILLLIDNVRLPDAKAEEAFVALLAKWPRIRWITFSEKKTDRLERDAGEGFKAARTIHIQPLSRKLIRRMSQIWSDQNGKDNQSVFSAVMNHLRRANLPRTGYMVTLLLWGMHQKKRFERVNEAVLLNFVSDHLLGRADFAQTQADFDPTAKEITLQHLSAFLRAAGGVCTKNAMVKELVEFFEQKGLLYDAIDITKNLIDCGILSESEGDIYFKYPCFQEFYGAQRLRNNSEMLSGVLSGNNIFEYVREIELLAGLRRENRDIISRICEIVDGVEPDLISSCSYGKFENIAIEENGAGLSERRIADIKARKLTSEQIDDLMDRADEQIAKRKSLGEKPKKQSTPGDVNNGSGIRVSTGANGELSLSEYLESVSLLGRVLKSSEFTDASEKVAATSIYFTAAAKIMHMYMDLFKAIMESFASSEGAPALSAEDRAGVTYLLLKLIVLWRSVVVANEIGTEKLFAIYAEVASSGSINMAAKFLIAMLMFDLGEPSWPAQWDELIEWSKGKRFALDLLMARIYYQLNTKPLTDAEWREVEAAAEKIDRAFGMQKRQIDYKKQSRRSVARETARDERSS